ncbi:DUF3149 domain-containing protein [Kangiella shandongensis]
MELLKELFSSPYGIFSAVGILFMLAMAAFFIILFVKKSAEKSDDQ